MVDDDRDTARRTVSTVRRRLLNGILSGGALALLGAIFYPIVRFVLPPKDEVYTQIEGLMNHFKLTIDGAQIPAGEVYSYSEAANGELGYYMVSDGTGMPYKCRVRSPCFTIMQSLDEVLLPGSMLPDIVQIFGSINMIGGECDR